MSFNRVHKHTFGSLALFVLVVANLVLAATAFAEVCCKYKYKLQPGPNQTGTISCQASSLFCQCEEASIKATDPGSGNVAISSRRANCYCYWTTEAGNVKVSDCTFDPGAGWVKLTPPMSTNPDICCFVKHPDNDTTYTVYPLDFFVDDCNGISCPTSGGGGT